MSAYGVEKCRYGALTVISVSYRANYRAVCIFLTFYLCRCAVYRETISQPDPEKGRKIAVEKYTFLCYNLMDY